MAFCAAIATAVVLGACGSGLPGDAVAVVGGAPITKAEFAHWLVVANDRTQGSTGVAAPPLPDPPNYTNCVAAERKINAADTADQLKSLCEQSYQSLLDQVVPYLVEAIWIQGEAADHGVKVTQAQVNTTFSTQRKGTNPPLATAAELNAFLAKSGQTVTDLKWRTYLNLDENALLLKVQKQAQQVSSAEIAAYYAKNRAALTTPATRDVHVVETKTLATANTVKALLASGSSYATVAPKYSIDPTSKGVGGKLIGVRPGELNSQLSGAIFAAKIHVLSGPLNTAFGYYVFTVDSSTPASVPTLKQATSQIKSTIASTNQTKATAALQSAFTKTWPSRTTCATGYIVASVCGNAPKAPSTSATGATG